jgi:hypothetical protein
MVLRETPGQKFQGVRSRALSRGQSITIIGPPTPSGFAFAMLMQSGIGAKPEGFASIFFNLDQDPRKWELFCGNILRCSGKACHDLGNEADRFTPD